MMAIVFGVACSLCFWILGIGLLVGSYAICEAINSTEETFEK